MQQARYAKVNASIRPAVKFDTLCTNGLFPEHGDRAVVPYPLVVSRKRGFLHQGEMDLYRFKEGWCRYKLRRR
jgi:hypothetical protein